MHASHVMKLLGVGLIYLMLLISFAIIGIVACSFDKIAQSIFKPKMEKHP